MQEDPPPRITTRAILVHLLEKMHEVERRQHEIMLEQRLHRQAFEKAVHRHRIIQVVSAVLEWRATLIAAGVGLAGWARFWRK